MQNITYKSIVVALTVSAFASSCKPKLDAPDPGKGTIDVSNYVALGNSITSGYADGALYYDGQMVSYPNLLAEQFKQIGGGEFKQPLVSASSQGAAPIATGGVSAKLVLGYKTDCKGVTALSPVPFASSGDPTVFTTNVSDQGPFNNLGIPGAKAITAVYAGYGNSANGPGNYNPFLTRILAQSEFSSASMLSKAAAQNPTFFSVFLGSNDVLAYALAGGTGGSANPITPVANFNGAYDLIINTMTQNGAKGVIANVPDVTNIPYFTTVPYNALTLDATQAAGLTAYYANVYPTSGLTFSEGPQPFIIKDGTGVRRIKSNEYILLTVPQDSIKCFGLGSQRPLSDKYVLTETEIANIQTAVANFNAKIKAAADAKGLAFVDVNAFMSKAKTGILYNGITTSSTFVSGGAFSLDGVHLTPRGNAMLANEFIKAINSTYGSTLPQVDATKYNGVAYP